MADQVTHADTCRVCGRPLIEGRTTPQDICDACASAQPANPDAAVFESPDHAPPAATPYGGYQAREPAAQTSPPDPDHPKWGPVTGIVTWLFSIGATIVIPLIAVLVYYFLERKRGAPLPAPGDEAGFRAWLQSPPVVLVMVASSIIAHVLTAVVCWAVVTRIRARPFWSSLGWNWGGKNFGYWLIASLIIIYVVLGVDQVLVKLLPQRPTPFDEILKTSDNVRFTVAAMAVLTAPLIEELVYRGVLFSGLRKRFSAWMTVILVTLLFAGVHVPQYWGAWASMAGLTLLSFVLTSIRALTKSILPCVLVHMLFNTVGAIGILKPDQSEMWLNVFTASALYVLLIWHLFIRRRSVRTES
jgi:uncharacterized protein